MNIIGSIAVSKIDTDDVYKITNFLINNAKFTFSKSQIYGRNNANYLFLKLFQSNELAYKIFWNAALKDEVTTAIIINDHPDKMEHINYA